MNKNISMCVIYNKRKKHKNTIKLAVCGSCFSRSAFTSTKYFIHGNGQIRG